MDMATARRAMGTTAAAGRTVTIGTVITFPAFMAAGDSGNLRRWSGRRDLVRDDVNRSTDADVRDNNRPPGHPAFTCHYVGLLARIGPNGAAVKFNG